MKNLLSIMFSDNAFILVVTKIGGKCCYVYFPKGDIRDNEREYRQINFKLEGD